MNQQAEILGSIMCIEALASLLEDVILESGEVSKIPSLHPLALIKIATYDIKQCLKESMCQEK